MALLVSLAGVFVFEAPAYASIDGYRVVGTAGIGLRVRANPYASNATVRAVLRDGAAFSIVCAVRGRRVYGNTVWHQISSPASGWISDYYTNTPGSNQYLPGERDCGSLSTVSPGRYQRAAAAAWAMAHAQDRQPYPAGCTWFASQALWLGQLPKSGAWTDRAGYSDGRFYRRGTMTANLAHSLKNYLVSRKLATLTPLGDMSTGAVPQAQVGDVITYDWDGDGVLNHFAVVVNIAAGQYPEVAEWGTSFPQPASYAKRGWNWSAKHNNWLQRGYGGHVRAYLLHITY